MNIKQLILDLEKLSPSIFNDIEEEAQFNYNAYFSKGYKDIPKAWVISVLSHLDTHGYTVRKITVDSDIDPKDNVIHLIRRK